MPETEFENCPKCSQPLNNNVECKHCGLIIEKFLITQEQSKEKEKRNAEKTDRKKRYKKFLKRVSIFTVVIIFLTILFTATDLKITDIIDTIVSNIFVSKNTQGSSKENSDQYDFLDHAKRATVLIKTSSGLGSGFFITPNKIVTNKHVVTFDQEEYEEYKSDIERGRKILELEIEKIKELKQKYEELPDGPTREQLQLIIENKEKDLEKEIAKHERQEKLLKELEDNMEDQNVTVILYNGEEYSTNFIETSDDYDIAIITVHNLSWTYLIPHPNMKKLKQGDTVYTIGSPIGLINTVTKGILSGYRWGKGDVEYLQTDAPINPGNSGGPLIDDEGYVYGINTLGYKDTEGLGFAIPVELVFGEFDIN